MVMPSWTPPPPQYQYHPGYQTRPPANGLATAAMVVSIVGLAGLCAWGPLSIFISPVGAVLGHVAKRRIKQTGESGDTMALVGIIFGWIGLGLGIIVLGLYIAFLWWFSTLPMERYTDTYP